MNDVEMERKEDDEDNEDEEKLTTREKEDKT